MTDLSSQIARMFCIGFDGPTMPPEVGQLIDRGVGSVILFARNFHSPQQAADLTAQLKLRAGSRPLTINVDQEGGRVMRLRSGATSIPSMRTLGRVNDPTLTREVGRILAREMRAINVDQVNAPVLDVDTNPANPVIADRSFGPDPDLVTSHGVALLQGIQSESVAACGKHFPGHGDTSNDSHFDLPHLPHNLDRLEHLELLPFRAAIAAGVSSIMTAHVIFDPLDPLFPATLSSAVTRDLLRTRLRFPGVVYTDDLEMKAIADHFDIAEVVIRAASATVDVLCICHTPELQHRAIDSLISAVEKGSVSRDLILASSARFDRLTARYTKPAASGKVSPIVGCDAHRRIVDRINELAETLLEPTSPDHDPTAVMDTLTKSHK